MLSDSLATPLAAAPEASASHHPTYRYAPNATHLVCVAGLHSFLVVYPVTLQAGAAYAVGAHAGGFVVQASGYSQRLPDLSVALAEAIAKFDPDPERFEMHAELLRCMHPYEYGVCSLPRASISSLKLSGGSEHQWLSIYSLTGRVSAIGSRSVRYGTRSMRCPKHSPTRQARRRLPQTYLVLIRYC